MSVRARVQPLVLLLPLLLAAAPAAPAPPAATGAPPAERSREASRALRRTPVVEVFEAARDAVVNISVTERIEVRRSPFDELFEDFFDMPGRGRQRSVERRSAGSGFVVHPDGYVVTNAHVVGGGAVELKVTFADGAEYDAEIVAADEMADLAVLRVSCDGSLPALPLGRSDDLMIGETVIAIGNPLGFEHTVTAGVVSAVDRAIRVRRDLAFEGLIQTDASINPGNSGGPLLNVLGELIGVNTAIRGDAQNIGFAISVDRLRAALPELLDVERRYRVVSGLRVSALGVPRVVSVDAGSPADAAGIHPGDRLLAVDGRPVARGFDWDFALLGRSAGERLAVAVAGPGGGEPREVELVLGLRPRPDGVALARTRLGASLRPLGEEASRRLGVREGRVLAIEEIEPESPAARAGLRVADLVIAMGPRRLYGVRGLDDVGRILEPMDAGDELRLRILRLAARGRGGEQLDGVVTLR